MREVLCAEAMSSDSEHCRRDPYFMRNPSKKKKFVISKYRIICYQQVEAVTVVQCSESVGTPIFYNFEITIK